MSKRLTVVVPTILAACVVAVSLNINSGRAADECLGAPNATAPEGRHWYYRVDRATGRKCWYLATQGMKVRQTASRTPPPLPRPATQPAEKPAEAAAGPAEVVTFFSKNWPHLPEPIDFLRRGSTSTSNSYAEETASTDAQDDMPLIWPVLSAAELAAAEPSSAPAIKTEHLLTLIASALALASIIMGLVYAISPFQRRRRHPHTRDIASNEARVQLRPFGSAGAEYRQTDALRRQIAARRAADLDRALREERFEFETRLRELGNASRRPAA